jgi:hypothetical protein
VDDTDDGEATDDTSEDRRATDYTDDTEGERARAGEHTKNTEGDKVRAAEGTEDTERDKVRAAENAEDTEGSEAGSLMRSARARKPQMTLDYGVRCWVLGVSIQ